MSKPRPIDLKTLKDITCTGCGKKFFQQVYAMKIIPRFSLPGITEDTITNITYDRCVSCGLIRIPPESNVDGGSNASNGDGKASDSDKQIFLTP